MSTRRFVALALLVTLLIAGVASYYASSHPDGLNFVAEDNGFSSAEKDSPASESPLAGYETKGVDDDRLSGGLAGAAGVVVVLVLGGGLFWGLRRRSSDDAPAEDTPAEDTRHPHDVEP